ncbi:FHA domain-containing protein, partial [Tessaracoccus lubricantis]|uniref:FHA domain-containing protein n=1 Tax=Tessaracoccus lubricantis TaxID=545543 RepID=UPI0036323E27
PPTPPRAWIPLPTPTPVIEPSVKVRQRSFGEVEEADGTRIANLPAQAGRAGDEGWYVRLDDGREVELSVTVLLGRNPQKSPEDPEVHLVPASGDGRMISRTHVLIGTDPRGVYVVDRGSTNGTALVTQGGRLEPCPAGTQVRVREGQQVSYGNRWFTVLRRPVIAG